VTSGPELRIGDAEREAAVTALGEHYAAGRLTKDEFDERADRAWAAKTSSALWPLFADLPRPQAPAPTASASPGRRPGPHPHGARPGWWFGVGLAPVLLLVVALVVLTHLPLFVVLILAWVFLARCGRHWSRSRYSAGGSPGHR
jgi:hypothetical protein